jgi:hypothetical protein
MPVPKLKAASAVFAVILLLTTGAFAYRAAGGSPAGGPPSPEKAEGDRPGDPTAAKPAGNLPYVQVGTDGAFYARGVPDADTGSGGTTHVYRVGRDKDELLDSYPWYALEKLTLGWSPTAGKVAVMARGGPTGSELSFHLGGKQLASYTVEDLSKLGVEVGLRRGPTGAVSHAEFRAVGYEQVPGTNDYRFVIETRGERLAFDILTGKTTGTSLAANPALRKEAPPRTEPTRDPKAGEWSAKKDGLVARFWLARDDEQKSLRVLLEVNNCNGLGGGVAFPGNPKVELAVFDAAGKALTAFLQDFNFLEPADPTDAVIPGTSVAVFRIDRGSGQGSRGGYLLQMYKAWLLEPGKAYTVTGKLVSRAKDPKGWTGPLDLPAVTVLVPPAATDPPAAPPGFGR